MVAAHWVCRCGLSVEVAGTGAPERRAALRSQLASATELVGFSPGSIGQLFFVQDVEFVWPFFRNSLPQFAVDSQHGQRAGEDDGVTVPSIKLQDAEEAFCEGHHPAAAEWVKGQ